jgi:hypothetical protein
MLLPEKHVTLAESILGLGAFLLLALDRPKTIDELYQHAQEGWANQSLPAFHSFDSVLLGILFLYSVGLIEATQTGAVRQCVS